MAVPGRPLIPVLFLALGACAGGHPPLGTIERIPGSTTHEGGTIVPVDSNRTMHRVGSSPATITGEIRPLHDSGASAAPHVDGAATAGEIVPLHDTAAVVPLEGTRWQGSAV